MVTCTGATCASSPASDARYTATRDKSAFWSDQLCSIVTTPRIANPAGWVAGAVVGAASVDADAVRVCPPRHTKAIAKLNNIRYCIRPQTKNQTKGSLKECPGRE